MTIDPSPDPRPRTIRRVSSVVLADADTLDADIPDPQVCDASSRSVGLEPACFLSSDALEVVLPGDLLSRCSRSHAWTVASYVAAAFVPMRRRTICALRPVPMRRRSNRSFGHSLVKFHDDSLLDAALFDVFRSGEIGRDVIIVVAAHIDDDAVLHGLRPSRSRPTACPVVACPAKQRTRPATSSTGFC